MEGSTASAHHTSHHCQLRRGPLHSLYSSASVSHFPCPTLKWRPSDRLPVQIDCSRLVCPFLFFLRPPSVASVPPCLTVVVPVSHSCPKEWRTLVLEHAALASIRGRVPLWFLSSTFSLSSLNFLFCHLCPLLSFLCLEISDQVPAYLHLAPLTRFFGS